ncbi:hypothetical protein [Desulfosporosinus nitroreducens]|uniref:hypothetical protein n=1 Tax=Desulfosporosinus nitroreducens TaxID=2018668 RepID=UPI00207D2F35|nr:hypothetical protein [Desulfosporosinus nitroreducens]MCO1603310.1 hypothetical protein [Desulfosporosinus nitroreducens]
MTALIMDNGVKFTQITDFKLVDMFIKSLLSLVERMGIKGTVIVDFSQVSVNRESVERSIRGSKLNCDGNLPCLITRY